MHTTANASHGAMRVSSRQTTCAPRSRGRSKSATSTHCCGSSRSEGSRSCPSSSALRCSTPRHGRWRSLGSPTIRGTPWCSLRPRSLLHSGVSSPTWRATERRSKRTRRHSTPQPPRTSSSSSRRLPAPRGAWTGGSSTRSARSHCSVSCRAVRTWPPRSGTWPWARAIAAVELDEAVAEIDEALAIIEGNHDAARRAVRARQCRVRARRHTARTGGWAHARRARRRVDRCRTRTAACAARGRRRATR